MSTRSVLLAVLALALSGTACQPPAQEAAGLSEEDVAAIRNNVEQEVVQIALAGDSAAFAAEHTEDAVRLPPNAPLIKGRADIEASYLPFNLTDLTQTLEEVEGRGDLAYARWTYELTGTVEGVPITDQGKGIVIYQRQPDGSWLTKAVIWNSDLPLAEEGSGT
jgi:ketosteroid isomerase-like protein